MTFEQYCAVIETTARAHGWSMFLPSLYELSPTPQLRVYESLPDPGTDRSVAHEWAQSFISAGSDIYLAYRDGEGMIMIEAIVQGQVTRSHLLNVGWHLQNWSFTNAHSENQDLSRGS